MSAEQKSPEHDMDEIIGEHLAVDSEEFALSALEHLNQGIESLESLTPESHEIVIRIGDRVIPASEIKLKLKASGEHIIEHKEIYIGIPAAVVGLLAARHALRTRRKK